jgi:hypothetical protein
MNVNIFFSYEDVQGRPPEEAKEACRNCPVRTSCLEESLAYEPFGFRGGMTAAQRRQLRKRRGIKVTPIHDYLTYLPDSHGLLADIHAAEPVEPLQLSLF